MLKKKRKAFTLVEVIIVLAIIAIIAAIAIPNLTKVRQDSKRKADIQTCETIKRTIDTLIIDETLRYNTAGESSLIINPPNSRLSTPTTDMTMVVVGLKDSTGSDLEDEDAFDLLEDYFSSLEIPQQDNGYGYKIEIDATGTITKVDTTSSEAGAYLN